ncbi:hypothetical protein [Xanthomonas oryzae pv. oryzae MAFF 311018]|nr:hypothetical protein [Xanthomonas oryzae pv. oryzae MAFF 311018]
MALQLRTGPSGLRCCEKGFAPDAQCTGWAARANSYVWRGVGTAKPHLSGRRRHPARNAIASVPIDFSRKILAATTRQDAISCFLPGGEFLPAHPRKKRIAAISRP